MTVLAPMTMGSVCQPEPPPTRYTLRAFHPNEASAFKTFTSGDWLNINEANLCDDPGWQDCMGPQPVCSSNDRDQYQVNIHDGWQIAGHEYRRDRVAFFTSVNTVTPHFIRGSDPFLSSGWWRYWEGEGESSRIDPLLEGPVRLVRRYERGACSAMTQDVAGLLLSEMGRTIQSSLRCERNKYYGCARALSHVESLGSMVWQYLGSDYCYGIKEANRDYYELAFAFELTPNMRWYESSKIRLSLRLWFQLGAGPRSAYLDCPSEQTCDPDRCFDSSGCIQEDWDYWSGCALPIDDCDACYKVRSGCEDCERTCSTRTCRQDTDCRGLPGVVCTAGPDVEQLQVHGAYCDASQGVCVKPHFLRAENYGLEFHVQPLGKCKKWLDYPCYSLAKRLSSNLSSMQAHAYRDVYAPLIQAMYDQSWADSRLFSCASDDDCQNDTIAERGFDSRCNQDTLRCDVRPMNIYKVNQYPDGLEFVLAWDDAASQYTLLNLGGMCSILGPDDEAYGWSDVQEFFPPYTEAPPVSHQ